MSVVHENSKLLKQYPISHALTMVDPVFHPLVEAARVGDYTCVQKTLLNADQQAIELAVHWSAQNNHISCLQILAEHAGVEHNSWAMIAAAAEGNTEIVRTLLPFSEAKTANSLGLSLSVQGNHWACFDLLKNVSHSSIPCPSALEKIVARNDQQNFDKILDYIQPSKKTTEALIQAAKCGYPHFVEPLIPLSQPTLYNSKALLCAVYNGHTECVKLLLPCSDTTANNGEILACAISNCHMDLVQMLLPLSNPNHHGRALVAVLWATQNCNKDNADNYQELVDIFCTPVNCSNALVYLQEHELSYFFTQKDKELVWAAIEEKIMHHQKQKLLDNIQGDGKTVQRKLKKI